MKLKKHLYSDKKSFVPVISISVPGYITSLIPTDKSARYFHLALVPRKLENKDEIIELGGPFAIEEFNRDFIKNQTDDTTL